MRNALVEKEMEKIDISSLCDAMSKALFEEMERQGINLEAGTLRMEKTPRTVRFNCYMRRYL